MKYYSGESVSIGDRVTYNGQSGCIALIGSESPSGALNVLRSEYAMTPKQVLVLFDNGARLMLDDVPEEDLLVLIKPQRNQTDDDAPTVG